MSVAERTTGSSKPSGKSQLRGQKPGVFLMTDSLQVGGTERQFTAIAQALDREQFRVQLGCLQKKGPFLKDVGEISEFNVGGSFFSLQAQRARFALARSLRTAGIAVAHSFDFYSNLMLIPAAKLAGTVVIGSQRQLGDLLTPMQFRAQAMAFRLCDRVVCNSRAAADRLAGHGLPEQKLVIIPNGLPEESFRQARPLFPRPAGRFRIGSIARMNDRVKNHAGLIRAMARLAQSVPGVELVLAGDGPLRPELEKLAASLGLGDQVRFLGDCHDIPGLLAAMDISVIFSFSESQSNASLESMAAGVPVVATRTGGNTEVVKDGETGLLVAPGDEQGLAETLKRAIAEPSLRARLSRGAKEFARTNFALQSVARQYQELYSGLLSEKAWRPLRRGRLRPAAGISRERLRVAIVAASPRWIGGQGVQANILMHKWQNDPDVEARFIPIDPKLPTMIRWVERVPFLRAPVRMVFYVAELLKTARDVDIVHVFSASYWSFLLSTLPARFVARLRRQKVLINYHSGEARDHLRRSRIAVGALLKTDSLVVPSAYLVNVFREFDLRAVAVPNIADLDQFCYRRRQPLRPLLANTRGFHPYYDIEAVIRAFALVQGRFPAARLCLVGRGPLEGKVRALAHEACVSGIEFAGCVSQERIGRIYGENDIFINASWLDNMPVSILEAFASGTPVVTTAPEGIRYMVEHERTGLLCAPGDWQALAENVVRLLREPDFALRLSQQAFEEVQRYRWDAIRPQWLQVYRSMCAVPGREQVLARPTPALADGEQRTQIKEETPESQAV